MSRLKLLGEGDGGAAHTHAEVDISDGSILARLAANEAISGAWDFSAGKIRLAQGLDANKPGSGNSEGHVYWATDTDKLYVWNGTAWAEVSFRAHAASHQGGGSDLVAAARLRTGTDAGKPASGNTEGDVWWATDTDKLYVWDGAAWKELGAAGAPTDAQYWTATAHASLTAEKLHVAINKALDESITSSATFQDDDHLSQAVGASETWLFEFHVMYEGTVAGDIRVAVNGPAGATVLYVASGFPSSIGTNVGDISKEGVNGFDAGRVYGAVGVGSVVDIYIKGRLVVGGTAGTFVLRWAQGTADATATIVKAGSSLKMWRP